VGGSDAADLGWAYRYRFGCLTILFCSHPGKLLLCAIAAAVVIGAGIILLLLLLLLLQAAG
jgi:hypothetical protein